MNLTTHRTKLLGQIAILFLGIIFFWVILIKLPTFPSDLHHFFQPAVKFWLAGESPYQITGFVNPPWLMFLLLPIAWLPEAHAFALMGLFSLVAVAVTVRFQGGGKYLLLAVLITPAMISLITLGQIDAWVLVGLLLGTYAVKRQQGWLLGLALALVLIKPQIGWLLVVLWLWKTSWPLKRIAIPVLGLIWVVSSITVGIWWPLGISMGSIIHSAAMDVSTRALITGLDLPNIVYIIIVLLLLVLWVLQTWRKPLNAYTISLSLLVAALASPYIARHSMVVILAVSYIWVGLRSWKWGVVIYILTLILLLNIGRGNWLGWYETIAYWVLLGGMLALRHRRLETKAFLA